MKGLQVELKFASDLFFKPEIIFVTDKYSPSLVYHSSEEEIVNKRYKLFLQLLYKATTVYFVGI